MMSAKPDLARGEALFERCASCHEPLDGNLQRGRVPRISGQHYSVLAKQITDFRGGRRWNSQMETVTDAHEMTLQSLADAAAYASRLVPPPPPAWTRPDPRERGAVLYERYCQSCHGVDGAGDARAVIPRIGGQHYDYLVWQFYDIEHGRRQNLPRSHVKRLGRLSLDEILDIADFLSRSYPAPQASR